MLVWEKPLNAGLGKTAIKFLICHIGKRATAEVIHGMCHRMAQLFNMGYLLLEI